MLCSMQLAIEMGIAELQHMDGECAIQQRVYQFFF